MVRTVRWLPRLGRWPRRRSAAIRTTRLGAGAPLLGSVLALALVSILAGGARPEPAPAARAAAAATAATAAASRAPAASLPASAQPPAPLSLAPPPLQAPLPQPPPPQPRALYRVVGCRSHGGPYRGGPPRREVAIGFDDGPAADTPAFVAMLERSHATATFFMIGRQLSGSFREMLLRELRDGDVLGDHTYSHPDLVTAGGSVRAQLSQPLGAIRALSGYTPCVFRPPYGAYDASVVAAARALSLATVLWNVDPTDWAQPGSGAIVQRVLAQVRPGSILISHDGGGPRGQTLAAYPAIIRALRARGYRIVTIPQLLGFRPVYVPCVRLCAGIGVPRLRLPRNAILQRAR
jgi:peptidoglycan/xylan/chitin deacetylase (PgdA/CDA1 family)